VSFAGVWLERGENTIDPTTPNEVIRALKRRISDAVYKSLVADTARTATNWHKWRLG
jgi:hypothetical protein